jgi:arginyl-tRNA synthetase
MNPFREFLATIQDILRGWSQDGSLPDGLPIDRITVEPPRDPSHGDMACNAAMVLAKPAKMKPRGLAERLAGALADLPDVVSTEVAGPGFLNLKLKDEFWHRRIDEILTAGTAYGDGDLGAGHPVNVEYVSANPTGPMHIGHARGAVVGDALAALLAKAGYDVTKEYYINDAGAQVDVLARSVYLRYREALGEDIGEIPAGLYPGDYLVPVGQALAKEHGYTFVNLTKRPNGCPSSAASPSRP